MKYMNSMKYKILALLVLCSGWSAMAGEGIRWLETVHDFGAFSEDDKIGAAFRFVNESSEPVVITNASATCGCTIPAYSDEAIAPGDTATINVTYNPVGRPGRFEKYVYVRTSAGLERHKLTIKGAVIGNPTTVQSRYPVDMGPLKLRNGAAMLGRIPAGSSKSEFLDGYNASRDSLRITFADVPEYLTVSSTPEVAPPGEIVNLNFFFSGQKCKQWGILTDSIKVSADGGQNYYTLPVVAIVEEDFRNLTPEELANAPQLSIADDRIDLGDVPNGSTTPLKAEVQLTNRGKTPLKIHRIYSQDRGVSATASSMTIKPGKTEKLHVEYDPSYQPTGIIDTRLTLIVNDPSAPTRSLRIVGLRTVNN